MVLLDAGCPDGGAWHPYPVKGAEREEWPEFRVEVVDPDQVRRFESKHAGGVLRFRRRRVLDPDTGKHVLVSEQTVPLSRDEQYLDEVVCPAVTGIRKLTIVPKGKATAELYAKALGRSLDVGEEICLDSESPDHAVLRALFRSHPSFLVFCIEKSLPPEVPREEDPETLLGKT